MQLLKTALLALNTSTVNTLRDIGTSIAQSELNSIKAKSFDNINVESTSYNVSRKLKTANFTFLIKKTVSQLNTETKKIIIDVEWQWKGKKYNHSIAAVVRK